MTYFKQMIRVYIDLMRSKLSEKLKLGKCNWKQLYRDCREFSAVNASSALHDDHC